MIKQAKRAKSVLMPTIFLEAKPPVLDTPEQLPSTSFKPASRLLNAAHVTYGRKRVVDVSQSRQLTSIHDAIVSVKQEM